MVDMAGCGPGSESEFEKLTKLKHFSDKQLSKKTFLVTYCT